MILFPEHLVFSYLLGGVAVVLIVTTVFTPFHKMGGGETGLGEHSDAGQEPTPAPANVIAMPAKTKKREGSDAPRDTPWRRVCREVATRYKLSPRETEIFFLIAKGRNAEYVQQKLVISTHTAKTHIANIYHKLGVHSSQEMLNLIEAFQDQEREERESQQK